MKYCFLFLFGVVALDVSSQQRDVLHHFELAWFSPAECSARGLSVGFEGADYRGDSFTLPVHADALQIPKGSKTATLSVENESVEAFTPGPGWGYSPAEVGAEFLLNYQISTGNDGPMAEFAVVPVRYHNGWERLISFDIRLLPSSVNTGAGRQQTWADHSVLSEGTWYKIAIARDGMYRIDKPFLESLGIDVSAVNPKQINIYGNGGSQLPFSNAVPRPDDLLKNAIQVVGEEDENFGPNDYILFYGQGSDSWTKDFGRFKHNKHNYSDSAYYFIRVDDPIAKRIAPVALSTLPETNVVSTFQDYQFVENEINNLAKSGREFYGETFDLNTSSSYSFSFPNMTSDPVWVDMAVAVRSPGSSSTFTFSAGGQSDEISPTATGTSPTSNVANLGSGNFTFTPSGSTVTVAVDFDKSSAEAVGWLDYLRINCSRELQFSGSQMKFRDTLSVGAGNTSRFILSQTGNLSQIWDITGLADAGSVAYTTNGSSAEFVVDTQTQREFIAFASGGFLVPVAIGPVINQDLHALGNVDLMIVSSPELVQAAEDLSAIHTEEGLNVAVVTSLQVFNEFSSGNPDVTAVKMLMKMLFDRAGEDESLRPKNLLLFGDGSFNNRTLAVHKGNNVICYESANSVSPTQSFVSDDYFVFLEDNDSESLTNTLDCGVGRIPASDISEALSYVNKVRQYMAANTTTDGGASCLGDQVQSSYGPWRNQIVFVSDDQDGSGGATEEEHMTQSEVLADSVYTYFNDYDVTKIYMDSYQQEVTPGGERYPEGEEAIKQRVQNGALIVNYVGHGGERGWAHERILDIPTIQNWTNLHRLPVFLTATCELARYDDPGFNSAGEVLVMNPQGGAIAMLTTTRIVYSGGNFQLDTSFYLFALRDQQISDLTLGKLNRLTKNNVTGGADANKRNFSLLGDPSLRMAYPKHQVVTTQINDVDLGTFSETLKALQEVKFTGYVADDQGNKMTGFNGFVYPTVYDKRSHITTLNNDVEGINLEYEMFNRILYKGKASVTNGDFSFRFVVPYDINYSVGTGRVSYYAVSGDEDAHGHSEEFSIGGALEGVELNTVGPEIGLYLNDTTFVSGGITSQAPVLLAKLRDENGINTVGNGIGHDLQAVLDGNNQDPVVLNDYYEADLDTYKSGEIRYQLSGLAEGLHTLRLKAWDVHNNSSDATLEFVVASNATLALEHVLNYPNPFTTSTQFMFEHNQACELLDVRIQIFTVGGKLVKTLEQEVATEGFRSEPIAWNGLDDFGDKIGRGVYVYKVEVKTPLGAHAEKFEKLVILN